MVPALRDISMNMTKGAVTCVTGRNGVGKTTLMKNIMGTLRNGAGSILLGDKEVGKLPPNKRAKSGIAAGSTGAADFSEADG